MKNLALTVLLLTSACASKPDTTESLDTVTTDTIQFVDEADSTYVASENEVEDIRASVDRLIEKEKGMLENGFTLRVSALGFEYRTDEVWRFDSLLNLVHSYQNWASEGSEGESHHIFRQERLYAVRFESGGSNFKDISIYHFELGGFSFSKAGSPADSVLTTLSSKYLAGAEREIKAQFSEIVKLLVANSEEISEGDPATLRLENTSESEESQGSEVTEITVDRKLLEKLLKR